MISKGFVGLNSDLFSRFSNKTGSKFGKVISFLLTFLSNGALIIWSVTTFTCSAITFPGGISADWSVVDAGDYNNDGFEDILYHRSSNGSLAIQGRNATGRTGVFFPRGFATTWSAWLQLITSC